MILFWILIFIVSLAALVKGADWLLEGAEKIGLAVGFSPFIVGAVIVAAGTSFPELVSSLVAVFKGVTEIVPANVVGSNIANILLVVGFAAVIGKRLIVEKEGAIWYFRFLLVCFSSAFSVSLSERLKKSCLSAS